MRSNIILLLSLFCIPLIFGIILLDFTGVFMYSDLPFAIAFAVYIGFLLLQHGSSRVSFVLALFLFVFMGFSYIPTGAGRITERAGEWMYIFFVFGIIHGIGEYVTNPKKNP